MAKESPARLLRVNAQIVEAIESLALVDHHVHGTLARDLNRDEFESVITESDRERRRGTSNFDSQFGFSIRKWCAPILGLAEFASPIEYVERRCELGSREVNHRLLRAAHLGGLLIDTGFATADLLGVRDMALAANAPTWEIVRLEAVAESVINAGATATNFGDRVRTVLHDAVAAGAVGSKSIAAYRYGLDVPADRPSEAEVQHAVSEWLREIEVSDMVRVSSPVLLSFLMWCGIDLHKPLQFHVGYGDSDINLARANPALLTEFIKKSEPVGTPIMLLHCYPYHRDAAYLAQIFPHVFFDIGEAINYSGRHATQLVRESLEIAPFAKQLYSSDGWGPAELHYLGARLWRNSIATVVSEWVEEGFCQYEEALRIVTMIGRENAENVYAIHAT